MVHVKALAPADSQQAASAEAMVHDEFDSDNSEGEVSYIVESRRGLSDRAHTTRHTCVTHGTFHFLFDGSVCTKLLSSAVFFGRLTPGDLTSLHLHPLSCDL